MYRYEVDQRKWKEHLDAHGEIPWIETCSFGGLVGAQEQTWVYHVKRDEPGGLYGFLAEDANARLAVGQLKKALGKVIRFDGFCGSLAEFLKRRQPYRKSTYVRIYARHKRNGCYAKLRTPAYERTVWFFGEDGREIGIDVSKAVYDWLDLPDKIYGEIQA